MRVFRSEATTSIMKTMREIHYLEPLGIRVAWGPSINAIFNLDAPLLEEIRNPSAQFSRKSMERKLQEKCFAPDLINVFATSKLTFKAFS
ncbi:hypothetical protein EVAR_50442_1 [Eumeta japonica]|uniref:Uncharacterized protein n=1 Tax=Eumeta variegata TaxID=151549 RepID=A0A4C1XWL4_EUMVA|nr:hypothetical protein EVAR_50442_1 [Eumeta japonica]